MSQLVDITITNRGASLDLLPGGPTLYGFDVDDIVSPIRFSSGLSRSYFTTRTNKGGVNNNHNGSKIDYRSSDLLAAIAAKSPILLLLTVLTRRGVDMSSEEMIFVSSKISEDLVPDVPSGGTKFFYIEDGDPLPVEYIVEETVPQIIATSSTSSFTIQDNGVDMPPETKLNFVGYTVEDNPGNNSTDIIAVKPIEYSDLLTLQNAGDLPLGAQYLITDKGDAGIIVDVSAPNKISLRAKGLFLVPDFQDVGTYTTTPDPKGTNQKAWVSSNEGTYSDGDIVFWNNVMYQVIDETQVDGSSPVLNSSAYGALTKNVNNGYILEVDAILYNFTDDIIIKREDKRGNVVGSVGQYFQWGNDDVSGNKASFDYSLNCANQRGILTNNICEGSSQVGVGETFTSTLSRNYFSGDQVDFRAACANTVGNCIFNNSFGIEISTTNGYYNKQIDGTHSTFDADLDMTDVAIFSAGVLTIPTILSFIGEFTLVGNTGQTINKIANLSNAHKVTRFKVEDGLTQSFQHVAVAGAIADTLNADAVTTNAIVGRTNSADFIEYERSGNKNVRTNIVKLA